MLQSQNKNVHPVIKKILWLADTREEGVKNRLCKRAGIESGHLHGFLKRNKPPKRETLKKIADAYGVSIEWLSSEEDISPTEFDRVTHKEQQDTTPTTRTREPAQHYHTEQAPVKQHDISMLIEITDRQSRTIDKLTDLLQNATKPPCHNHETKPPPTKAPPGKNPGVVRLHRKKSRKL